MEKKNQGGQPSPTGGAGSTFCQVPGCKTGPKRFGFCDPHFEHFKFGLIRANGDKALDYDRKFEHLMAQKSKGTPFKKAA